MTLLTVIQGKNCALLTSDLLMGSCTPEEMRLPRQLRTYHFSRVPTKWRQNIFGDYIGWHGALTPQEDMALYQTSLKKLEREGIQTVQTRADAMSTVIFYAKANNAQLYQGYSDGNISPLHFGQSSYAGIPPEFSEAFVGRVARALRANPKYNAQAFREVSKVIEGLYFEYEQCCENFGGFTSHLLFPNRLETIAFNLGKVVNHPPFS